MIGRREVVNDAIGTSRRCAAVHHHDGNWGQTGHAALTCPGYLQRS